MNDLKARVESEAQSVTRITNSMLQCKDCKFRLDDSKIFGNTSRCRRYSLKPSQVIKGGDCIKYIKED